MIDHVLPTNFYIMLKHPSVKYIDIGLMRVDEAEKQRIVPNFENGNDSLMIFIKTIAIVPILGYNTLV